MQAAPLSLLINHFQLEGKTTLSKARHVSVEVENFLSSSRPSLVHLTRRLVEIGCYSEQDFFAMASREKETRYRDLREILKVFDDAKRKEDC